MVGVPKALVLGVVPKGLEAGFEPNMLSLGPPAAANPGVDVEANEAKPLPEDDAADPNGDAAAVDPKAEGR